jgi:hypothetical protein
MLAGEVSNASEQRASVLDGEDKDGLRRQAEAHASDPPSPSFVALEC